MAGLSSNLFPPVFLTHQTAVRTFLTGDMKWQKFLWCFDFCHGLLLDMINTILVIRQWNHVYDQRTDGVILTHRPFKGGKLQL